MESNKVITGYRLKHPSSNRHYIGITSQSCNDRLSRHLNDKENNKRTAWIKSHINEINLFYMEPFFHTTDLNLAKKLEIFWIAEDRKEFGRDNIMNGTDGGDGTVGHITTEETKMKLSNAMKGENNPNFGKHIPNETKLKMSASAKGRVSWIIGKHHSEETRQQISRSNKGKLKSMESRARMSQAKRGKPSTRKGIKNLSPIAGDKISASKVKFNKNDIIEIFSLIDEKLPYSKIGKMFNVSAATISNIKNGKIKFYKKLMGDNNANK